MMSSEILLSSCGSILRAVWAEVVDLLLLVLKTEQADRSWRELAARACSREEEPRRICGYRAHRAAREGEKRVAGVEADLTLKTSLTARGARARVRLLREESRIGTAGGSVAGRGQQ